jgi:hypothetical protein
MLCSRVYLRLHHFYSYHIILLFTNYSTNYKHLQLLNFLAMPSRVITFPCLQIQRPHLLLQIRTTTSKSFILIAYYDRIIYARDIVNDAEVASILISFQIDIFLHYVASFYEKEFTKGYRYSDMLDPLNCQSALI